MGAQPTRQWLRDTPRDVTTLRLEKVVVGKALTPELVHEIGVVVQVDEAWGQHEAPRLDLPAGATRSLAHRDDLVASHRQVTGSV